MQPVGRLEVADNADVSAPLRDAFNDRQALTFVEADLYRGAPCDVGREVRNQDDDRGLVRQNPDIGRIVRGKRAERIGYSVERLDDLTRMTDERFARGGRDDSRVLAPMRLLAAEGTMYSRSAALVMLPWSITLMKSFSVVRSNRTDSRAWEHSGGEETFYPGVERRAEAHRRGRTPAPRVWWPQA